MIAIENLCVTFGTGQRQIRAVRGASFAIPRGEIFGLVGESGAGKSTVLRALAGLVRAEGRIEIAGKAMTARRARNIRAGAEAGEGGSLAKGLARSETTSPVRMVSSTSHQPHRLRTMINAWVTHV